MPFPVLAILLGLTPQSPPPRLTFSHLLEDRDGRLAPTRKLLDAAGKRVRLTGFVADMERPPNGGFWLCPRPVAADESGGGTADLPPESVFVVVRSSPDAVFKPPRQAVEVSGTLQLGPKALPDGTMTHLRLLLDRSSLSAPPAKPASPQGKAKPQRLKSLKPRA